MPQVQINGDRLLEDLRELKEFGARGAGVVRQAFSPIDMKSRFWLIKKLEDSGLCAELDCVGNVLGVVPDVDQALLMGSHTDTQPEGGWLDGAMGVIYALEITRAAREQHGCRYPIDVASWMDEEGYYLTCLGSRSFCDRLSQREIDQAVTADGQKLTEMLAALEFRDKRRLRLDPLRNLAYFEAHIEQGCVLERLGKRIGVVTGIVGGVAYRVALFGEQNHAGTTPMSMRRDAGMAFIELAHAINKSFKTVASPNSVWTIGDVRFSPGAVNTIPGHCEFVLEFRDIEENVIQRMIKCLNEIVSDFGKDGKVAIEIKPLGDPIPPSQMDLTIQEYIADAAECLVPGKWMEMQSGAGHDAAIFADLVPTGMLFVPSIGGISHSFAENTSDDDIVLGCQVMADAAVAYLNSALHV